MSKTIKKVVQKYGAITNAERKEQHLKDLEIMMRLKAKRGIFVKVSNTPNTWVLKHNS